MQRVDSSAKYAKTPFGKIEKGSGNTAIQCHVYICGQNWRCARLHGLHDSIVQQTILSVLREGGTNLIASPMSEDCCHNTSASNVYIAAWQEIVKPAKVTELYVCFIVRTKLGYVGTERSDRPGFMHKTCFSPFKPYLQLR